MEQFKPLSPLCLTGNRTENWRIWEQSFRHYVTDSGACEQDENVKIAILLNTIGEEALEVYNTLSITPEGDELTVEDVLQAFKHYCRPQKNVVLERYQFWSHEMAPGTSLDQYLTELRDLVKDCEFGMTENDMLRDKLLFIVTEPRLKRRLLMERRLTFNRAVELCRASGVFED